MIFRAGDSRMSPTPALYETPSNAMREPRTGFAWSFRARATFSAQKRGIAWFTSPASSMKSVGEPNSRARQER